MQLVTSIAQQWATALTLLGEARSQREHHFLQDGWLPKTTNQ